MEYEIGKVGRIIVARGFDGEDVYKNIEAIAVKEGVNSAAVMVLGGLRRAKVVCGPKDPAGPLEAIWEQFDDAREIAGVGTIFCDDDQPRLHLHGAIGRGKSAIAGCGFPRWMLGGLPWLRQYLPFWRYQLCRGSIGG